MAGFFRSRGWVSSRGAISLAFLYITCYGLLASFGSRFLALLVICSQAVLHVFVLFPSYVVAGRQYAMVPVSLAALSFSIMDFVLPLYLHS